MTPTWLWFRRPLDEPVATIRRLLNQYASDVWRLSIVQFEITGRIMRGTHGTQWRGLLRAGIATAVIGTAIPADAAWFLDRQPIAQPLPDPIGIQVKRQ